ncbi:MAG: hypothetical protein MAG453_02127 [Calditrichaeota bacterium]|nr:hypothetical protein [Calditrichota bacterium]
MGGKGTILRLIDVVLIILVGFVSISDISDKSRIRFPFTQKEAAESDVETQAIVSIVVTVDETDRRQVQRELLGDDGFFHKYGVELFNPHYLINWRQGETEVSREAESSEKLEQELESLVAEYGRNIEALNVVPTDQSPVGGTVAIYDIADRLDLPFPGVDLSGEVASEEEPQG